MRVFRTQNTWRIICEIDAGNKSAISTSQWIKLTRAVHKMWIGNYIKQFSETAVLCHCKARDAQIQILLVSINLYYPLMCLGLMKTVGDA